MFFNLNNITFIYKIIFNLFYLIRDFNIYIIINKNNINITNYILFSKLFIKNYILFKVC